MIFCARLYGLMKRNGDLVQKNIELHLEILDLIQMLKDREKELEEIRKRVVEKQSLRHTMERA